LIVGVDLVILAGSIEIPLRGIHTRLGQGRAQVPMLIP
jgi:hypothetical protein